MSPGLKLSETICHCQRQRITIRKGKPYFPSLHPALCFLPLIRRSWTGGLVGGEYPSFLS